MQREDVADVRVAGVRPPQPVRVGIGGAEFLPDRVAAILHRDIVVLALAHLALAVQAHDARRGTVQRLRIGEHRSVQVVEPPCDLPRQLQVLGLVVAHGDAVGLDAQDVRGLEHGVGEQPRVDVLLVLGGLVLELGHPFQGADGGAGAEDPGQLHGFGYVGLHEQSTAVRVESAGDAHRGGIQDGVPHGVRLVLYRDGVVVHDAVDTVVPRNQLGPVGHGAEVVPDVNVAGGLDAAVQPGRPGGRRLMFIRVHV